MNFNKKNKITLILLIFDALAIYYAYYCALYVSFECRVDEIPLMCIQGFYKLLPLCIIITWIINWQCSLYNCIWRFINYQEFFKFSLTTLLNISIFVLFGKIIVPDMPIRYYIIGGWILLWLILFSRFSYRLLFLFIANDQKIEKNGEFFKKVMLIGGGAAGQIILRDTLLNKANNAKILCIIDDDQNKWGCTLNGIPVVGGRDAIFINVKKFGVEEIFLAIPSIDKDDKREILDTCYETECKVKVLPGIEQLVKGNIGINQLHAVTPEELLGRKPIKVNNNDILENLLGKVIIVTGGGGSIGSELCRQIASSNPKQLIIFDIYENNLYDIEQELKYKFPDLSLITLVGSVRDTKRLKYVFCKYHPEIVFHAAAHKHVPLMEDSPYEAIKNNVFGTYKTAYIAMVSGCKKFILISSDKAVNPTNIMGASKRLCEMIIQNLNKINITENYDLLLKQLSKHGEHITTKELDLLKNRIDKTEFVAVRFGNVLGSNGSVIPLFKKQIEQGGPVKVTHPDIIRYFMTIPEAVSLVLQAATYAKGGEIFVLDMGEPVRIVTLARNLISLHGLKPDVDIKIEYSGLRPGEKLFEEKLMSEEGLETTPNKLIHVAKPIELNIVEFMKNLSDLSNISYRNEQDVFDMVDKIVPTYNRI